MSDVLRSFIESARWFGGKGREWELVAVRRVGELPDTPEGLRVVVDLAELRYTDATAGEGAGQGAGEGSELYQLPLALYAEPQEQLAHAFVGEWEDPDHGRAYVYDALHDRHSMHLWLRAFASADAETAAQQGQLTFHRLPGHELDLEQHSTLFSGEQSNSSVAFGEDSVLKLFRKLTPGANPDITTHEVLTRVGSEHVAALYGWVEQTTGDEVLHLGMLQQFLRTATDGWELALTSIRNLFADPGVPARDAGGDFAGEAARLGEALRDVHDVLRREIEVSPGLVPTPAAIAGAMSARLDAALLVVPGLDRHAERLRAAYAALGALPEVPVQQVHGDLHLGQTLRTSLGWKIVDFEGEPAKPLADRLLPDSPWRDVAGMLRSFDYAPSVVERDLLEPDDPERAELRARGEEWSERNQRYFLQAYAGGDLTAEQHLLVHAYLADKAVYEAVYETRNRPSWVDIPLAGIARIGT